jgi:hypothetical protein
VQQGVVGPGHGGARGQQDQRVQERQVPGIERLDALGRPHAAGELEALGLDRVGGVEGGLEIGPEPRHEEHHLGGDEHDHAVAVMELDDAGVVAGIGLVGDVLPPREHGVEHAERAGTEHVGADGEAAGGETLHPEDGAEGHQEPGERAQQRPRARVDDVVIVVLGVRPGHRDASPSPRPVTA